MRWLLKKHPPQSFQNQFPGYSGLVQQLFWDRGINIQEKINEFFYPDYDMDSHDPFLLKDIGKAVKRIQQAIKNKEKIAIYGDYDADGVSASAILYDYFGLHKIKPEVYTPDRLKEGYGLNKKALEYLADKRVKLIITADNGSTNIEEAEFAKEKGMDLIITDHHQVLLGRPDVIAFVNPHQKRDKYPFKNLCGTGVAFKLIQALIRKDKKNKKNIPRGWEKWLLDLVALATVADCMPLLGENRLLVKYGLVVLAQTKRLGLKKLMEIAGISQASIQQKEIEREKGCIVKEYQVKGIDSYTFGFILAPRLNAASRMDHANNAFELLIERKADRAEELAKKIHRTNQLRQNRVDHILKEVEKKMAGRELPPVIFEGDQSWSIGLVGVVAGRLTEKYYRPAFIYEQDQHYAKGSVRTIPGVSAVELLQENDSLLESYGGHPMAAGFKLRNENLSDFKKEIERSVAGRIKGLDLNPTLEIDQEVSGADINWLTYEDIEKFAPFGEKNQRPKFLLRDATVVSKRTIGVNGKHLRLSLKTANGSNQKVILEAIFFNHTTNIKVGDKVDLVFEFQVNEWRGARKLELKVLDIKRHTA